MNNELIKRIDRERDVYRLYGFDGCDTDLLLADLKAEIERLSKPYIPMTEIDRYRIKDSFEYATSGELGKIAIVETAVIARYNEQRGVK